VALNAKESHGLPHALHTQQIELELLLTQSRYSDIYDFAPVGYVPIDLESWIVEVNLSVAEILRAQRNKLVGNRWSAFSYLQV